MEAMQKLHISKYLFVVAICLIVYTEIGETQTTTKVEDVPLSDYTTELKKSLTPASLSGWYKMTNGFISVVHSKSKETIDLLIGFIKERRIEFPKSLISLLKAQAAMFACVVIGLLFVITMWVTGLVFFCCRMCGNCGGERVQVITKSTSAWRKSLILLLIIFFALLMPAVITLFIINSSLNASMSETEKTVYTSLDDADIFLSNTRKQVEFVVETGTKTTVRDISARIDNADEFIKSKLSAVQLDANILKKASGALKGWLNIFDGVKQILDSSEKIKSGTLDIHTQMTGLKDQVTELKEECGDECKDIDPEVFKLTDEPLFDMSSLQETHDNLNKLDEKEYNQALEDMQRAVTDLPSVVAKKTLPIREAVKRDLMIFGQEVPSSEPIQRFQNLTEDARNEIEKVRHHAHQAFPAVRSSDKYRWYFGLTVSILVASVCSGLFFGLFCGICGHQSNREATKRSSMSNGAGLILMLTVYWMFLLSGFLMLVTTALFAAGGVLEVYLCRPLFDEKFEFLDQVMDVFQPVTTLNGSSMIRNIVPSEILRKCANDETAYVVFNMSLDLKSELHYKEKLKMDKRLAELQAIRVPFQMLTDNSITAIDKMSVALNISISNDIYIKLRGDLINHEKYDQQLSFLNQSNIGGKIKLVETMKEGVEKLEGLRKELATGIEHLVKSSLQLQEGVAILVITVKAYEENFQKIMPGLINKVSKQFVDELVEYGDALIDNITKEIETKVARCKPLWNIFDSSRTLVCKYYIQPLNGIWFAIGWSLFFYIPTIIVATKLSKHFRKMSSVKSSEVNEKNSFELECTNGYKVKQKNGWPSASHHL